MGMVRGVACNVVLLLVVVLILIFGLPLAFIGGFVDWLVHGRGSEPKAFVVGNKNFYFRDGRVVFLDDRKR